MNQSLKKAKDSFFQNCQYVSRAPGSYFWSGEHAVMYGQLAVVHPLPLYAYVGIEQGNFSEFEFEVRGIKKKANIFPRTLNVDDIELIDQWHEKERVKKYLEFWAEKNKQPCFKTKIWFEVPPKCGLNSSGAIGASLAGLIQIIEAKEKDRPDVVKRINNWNSKPIVDLKKDTLFKKTFLDAWILDDCSHGFSSSGNGPFCSLVGSPNGQLVMYFTQRKGFNSHHPIKRIEKTVEELKFQDFERIGNKINNIQWWGKRLNLKRNFKEYHGTAVVYCGVPKDTGNVLKELNEKYAIPFEVFKSSFLNVFKEHDFKQDNLAFPVCGFLKNTKSLNSNSYMKSKSLNSNSYMKSLFCESLGLLSWRLVQLIREYQGDTNEIRSTIETINRFLAFYGVVREDQVGLYETVKKINSDVGIKMTGKMTGAGCGGDLVILGDIDSIEGIQNQLPGSYPVHFATNRMGWKANGLTIVQTNQDNISTSEINRVKSSVKKASYIPFTFPQTEWVGKQMD